MQKLPLGGFLFFWREVVTLTCPLTDQISVFSNRQFFDSETNWIKGKSFWSNFLTCENITFKGWA
jgi:hypothetical protein